MESVHGFFLSVFIPENGWFWLYQKMYNVQDDTEIPEVSQIIGQERKFHIDVDMSKGYRVQMHEPPVNAGRNSQWRNERLSSEQSWNNLSSKMTVVLNNETKQKLIFIKSYSYKYLSEQMR